MTRFFSGLLVSLSPTTTVTSEQHRCKNRVISVWKAKRRVMWVDIQGKFPEVMMPNQRRREHVWSGFEWVSGLPLLSSQSELFKLPLFLSHIKNLPHDSLTSVDFYSWDWVQSQKPEGTRLLHEAPTRQKIEPIHQLLFCSQRALFTWLYKVSYERKGFGILADLRNYILGFYWS